jgi:N-acetylglutamate synthase-like GNAT family acetyltransferase
MNFVIRSATQDDVTSLVTIIRQASRDVAERFGLTPENCPRHTSNCTTEWIETAFEKGITYYVLEADGSPCGCVALEQANSDVCYLERLAVLPQFRRQGFGEALVNHVCTKAKRLGAKRVEIGIIAENVELRRWYEKFEFRLKNTAEFDHLPFTVAFMSKELGV